MFNPPNSKSQPLNLWMLFKQLSTIRQIAFVAAICFIPVIVITVNRPVGIFWVNQNHYYIYGMYEAGVDYLQNDLDASMRPTHIVFTKLIFLLQSLDMLAVGSQIFSILLYAVFGVSLMVLGTGLTIAWQQRQNKDIQPHDILTGISIAIVFSLLLNQIFPTHLRLMAMADLNLISYYFQASDFGVFILLGIALLSIRRWRLATVCFIIASLFHSNYLTLSAPLMLVLLYENYRLKNLREGLILFTIFIGVNLPLFVLGPLQWSQANSAEAIYTLNYVRSPHHYDVNFWWNSAELGRILLMGVATIFATWKFNSIFRNIMILYFGYIVSAIIFVALTDSLTVASLLPWRASSFILPISVFIIIGIVILIFFELGLEKYRTVIFVLLSAVLVLRTVSLAPWDLPDAYREYTTPEIEMVREHTQTHDLILIPPRLDDSFRVYAERPIFVMWKTIGYFGDDWLHRIQIADEMMDATFERQNELCAEYQFAYYLLPATAQAASDVAIIDRTEDYLLVACPSTTVYQPKQVM